MQRLVANNREQCFLCGPWGKFSTISEPFVVHSVDLVAEHSVSERTAPVFVSCCGMNPAAQVEDTWGSQRKPLPSNGNEDGC